MRARGVGTAVRAGVLRGDLSLLGTGLSLGWSFGLGSLEELARTALELENGIYRTGSLRRVGPRVGFRLENPPIRIGAFRAVEVAWDGTKLPATAAWVATDHRPELRVLASISESDPVRLETGEGSRFELAPPGGPVPGPHRVRVDWHCRAVPPMTWLEFVDRIEEREGP